MRLANPIDYAIHPHERHYEWFVVLLPADGSRPGILSGWHDPNDARESSRFEELGPIRHTAVIYHRNLLPKLGLDSQNLEDWRRGAELALERR